MIVYHGSVSTVVHPDIIHSYRNLDFGKGFYVTTNREQAEKWALRKAAFHTDRKAVINIYQMQECPEHIKAKKFKEDLSEWIDFVCRCRDGNEDYLDYDIIMGKVADDKVFKVVDMYHSGIWDRNRALQEIKAYESYDQIAFITQRSIDQLLIYQSSEEVK